jgi:hypothetical protein
VISGLLLFDGFGREAEYIYMGKRKRKKKEEEDVYIDEIRFVALRITQII